MWIVIILVFQICIKSNRRLLIQTFFNDIFQIRESASTDKQNISCIYRCQWNHCILAVGSDRHFHICSFQKFQHTLLYSFSADISLIGIFLLCDLVNLINKDDSMLSLLHIIISRCKQFGNNTFNIITNISCFCKRSRIGNRQRNIKQFGQCFDQIGLSASGRSDHQHIGFFNCDLIHGICCYTFIMVVNGNGHYLLGIFLTDHIFIQGSLDLMRCRNLLEIQDWFFLFCFFLFGFLPLSHLILETAEIDHADIWHIEQITIIKISCLHLLIHTVKASLHTVRTYMYIIRKIDHLTNLTLCPMTERTVLLRFFLVFFLIIVIADLSL